MCGIAGWLGVAPNDVDVAVRMVQSLRHRGPDGQGVKAWSEATLIHTRLSIIDLSPAGAQPMSNEDGTVWTVFNGEIYNHRNIRQRLERSGHTFKGHSDTEILPHLYEETKTAFAAELRGMFALAVYDTETHTLVLTRDRFGIKPLFYAPRHDRLVFASEINSLLEIPDIDIQPSKQAIHDFAALSFIPAPQTFYSGIYALQPGETLEARFDGHQVCWNIRTYHQWAVTPDPTMSLDQATDRADELVRTAVRQQMESDVPLGSLLSGGIDSSLVSAAAQVALDGKLKTFNERFAEQEYDETSAALAVAEHIGSHHQMLDMDHVPGTWDYVRDLLLHAGQPFADASLFAVYAICRLVRQHVTVVVSGDGGDEGFGGYNLYSWLNPICRWQSLSKPVQGGVSAALALLTHMKIAPQNLSTRALDLSNGDNTAVIQYLFSRMREKEHGRFCQQAGLLPIRRLFEPQWEHRLLPKAPRLEQLSAHATEANIRLNLANDFLFKVDTASMKESLEVRVPLLDEELFAFGLSLPHHLKVKGRMSKRTLRAVARRRLPSAIASKPKRGFAIPFDTWTDRDFKIRLRDILLSSSSQLPEFFYPEVYRPMVTAFCEERPYPEQSRWSLCQRILMLLSVQLTLDRSLR